MLIDNKSYRQGKENRNLTHSEYKEQFSPVLFWIFTFFNCTGWKGLKRTQKKIPLKWQ